MKLKGDGGHSAALCAYRDPLKGKYLFILSALTQIAFVNFRYSSRKHQKTSPPQTFVSQKS